MHIDVTLGGALVKFLPPGNSGNHFIIEKESSVSVAALLGELGVPEHQRLLVIMNGNVVQPPDFDTTWLNHGDNIALMPPITAG